jgi:hypothetical protein
MNKSESPFAKDFGHISLGDGHRIGWMIQFKMLRVQLACYGSQREE